MAGTSIFDDMYEDDFTLPEKPKVKSIFDIMSENDADALRQFIKDNPNSIEELDSDYNATPIIHAAYYNLIEMLDVLIDAGANLDHQDDDGETALICASKCGHLQALKKLMAAGADITKQRNNGQTAEDVAANEGIKDEILRSRCGKFIKENDYLVSITEYAKTCKMSLSTLYNFKAQTITTESQNNNGLVLFVQDFNAVRGQKQLQEAAQFLKANGGDLHGFKTPAII